MKLNCSMLALLIVLLLVPNVFADVDVLGVDCEGAFSLDPQAQAKCELETRYIYEAQVLIDQNDLIMEQTQVVTSEYGQTFPDVEEIRLAVLYVAESLLLLVLLYGGYLWIISAADPEQRHYAKKILINLFYMIVFVNAAFFLFDIALDFSNSVVAYIADDAPEFFDAKPWEELTSTYTGDLNLDDAFERYNIIQSPSRVLYFTGWSYVLLMQLRNILILALYIIAPLVLVLLLFVPTREYGKLLLILFLVEVFLPVIFFIIFKGASLLFSGTSIEYNFILICSALFCAALLHVLLVFAAVSFSAYKIIRGEFI